MEDGSKNNRFPDGFIFGTATSAFQIEGEGNTEWKDFTGDDGTRLGNAIGHYERYLEDLEYISYLGNAYRFSPDWSRLQHSPLRQLDRQALDHYGTILKKLKEKNMKILLVLNHFSNPIWMYKTGGWANKDSVNFYLDYTKKLLKEFSVYIDFINTFNEPNAYVNMAYIFRKFPPFKFNPFFRSKALSNMAKSHRLLYEYMKEKYPDIPAGISHAHILIEPLGRETLTYKFISSYFDSMMHEKVHEYFTGNGKYIDFTGFSYYGRIPVGSLPLMPYNRRGKKELDRLGIVHDDMWELYPEGIYRMLKFFYSKYKKPLIITENGTCTDDDSLRKKSLHNHLFYVKKACDEGIPVKGYFHWSTFDNFELNHGPSRRFGLTSVDFKSGTFNRQLKDSGHYYHKIVKTNSLVAI